MVERSVDVRLVDALERLVFEAVGLTATALAEFAPATDLTLPQWRALVIVTRADGIRIGEVGGRMGMALPSASRLIRRLERRGLVATARDVRDRRATIARPTAAGIELSAGLAAHRRRMIGEILDHLAAPLQPELATDLELVGDALEEYR